MHQFFPIRIFILN